MPSLVVINTDGESSEVELSPDQTEKDIKKFLTDSFKTKKQLDTIKQHILNKEKEDKDYVRQQFKKLDNTIYGFSIVISDGNGNKTNTMKLTPQRAELIIKILKEKENE